jgi:hypothetical protein
VHQYETSLLQNDLWRDLSGEGQKGVKVSAVSEKIRKLAGRGSRRAGKGKGLKAGRGRACNFTDEASMCGSFSQGVPPLSPSENACLPETNDNSVLILDTDQELMRCLTLTVGTRAVLPSDSLSVSDLLKLHLPMFSTTIPSMEPNEYFSNHTPVVWCATVWQRIRAHLAGVAAHMIVLYTIVWFQSHFC